MTEQDTRRSLLMSRVGPFLSVAQNALTREMNLLQERPAREARLSDVRIQEYTNLIQTMIDCGRRAQALGKELRR
jgi:hypothetical protein